MLRRHWPLLIVAGCAAALRAVVLLAYRPALIFPDSERYLQYTQQYIAGHWYPDWLRTSGYSLLLIPAVLIHNLMVVPLAQHLLGLATAVLIYAVLVHFGSRRWLAALATVPVLFDPLQLDIEQYVLTDVSATFLLAAALVVLVWNRGAIGRVAPVVAGLLLAVATDIRQSDLIVIIPAAVYLVAAVRPWHRLAVRASLLLAGFLLPVFGYLGWFQATRGQFDFASYNGEFMYGRIAQFIDCTGVPMPAYERHLCPSQPPAQRNPDFYMWAPQSPQVTLKAPPGMSKDDIIINFDRRIIEHQPLTYLKVVADDALYSFSPVRGAGPEQYPIWYHQFTHTTRLTRAGSRDAEVAHPDRPSNRHSRISCPATVGISTCRARCSPPVSSSARPEWRGSAGRGTAGCARPACCSRSAVAAVEPRSSSPTSTGGISCRDSR